jgi:hypothetical protein
MAMRSLAYPNAVADHALGQARQPLPATTKTIPFDYAFQFTLNGERDNRVQDVVEISMEGVFVALSMGYSVVLDEQRRARTFQPVISQTTVPHNPVLVPFFPATFPTAPFGSFLVAGMPESEIAILAPTAAPPNIILRTKTPSGTIQSTSRIGSNGTVEVNLETPVVLGSILRVWDRTNNLLSQVFEVNFPTTTPVIGPHHATRRLPSAGETTVDVYGFPGNDVSVFLLQSTTGSVSRVTRKVKHPDGTSTEHDTFTLDVDTVTFGQRTGKASVPLDQPLSPGDVLLVRTEQDGIDPFSMFTIPRPRLSTIPLGALEAGLARKGIEADLTGGFRLNPNFATLAAADPPLDQLTAEALARAFETGAVAAAEASFRYSIDVVSTGRELQNKEIHNIAGLGIANGDRPFRPFAKPMMFEPRSSIRIQITEISGPPGTLFIVLQGYKILGTGRIPG